MAQQATMRAVEILRSKMNEHMLLLPLSPYDPPGTGVSFHVGRITQMNVRSRPVRVRQRHITCSFNSVHRPALQNPTLTIGHIDAVLAAKLPTKTDKMVEYVVAESNR